jgi:SWI/SNF-related matrix-associated actin-dependent regulator 1 of chromatin subfamily A
MFKPLEYQIDDAAAMADNWFLPNFSEAGTGKTYTTIRALQVAKAKGGLIVAPVIALKMWQEEIARHLGAEARIVKTMDEPIVAADFQIMSYAVATQRAIEVASCFPYRGDTVLIADESHYLKSFEAQRTRAVYAAQERLGGMWCLTGTPIVAYPNDLYPMLHMLHVRRLEKLGIDNEQDFIRRFCRTKLTKIKTQYGNKMILSLCGSQDEVVLNDLIYGKIGAIRRTQAKDGAAMPPMTVRTVYAHSVGERDLHELDGLSVAEIMALLAGEHGDNTPIATVRRKLGVLKVPDTAEYIKGIIAEGHGPVLCGIWHKDVSAALAEELKKLRIAIVDGSSNEKHRERVKDDFNGGKLDVLIGQIGAMGVSWNLQKLANRVVVCEDVTSPSVLEQFVKRVWRLGQGSHVQVDIIKADVKLDNAITKLRESKESSIDKIIGSAKSIT